MKKQIILFFLVVTVFPSLKLQASGISVDAGLTPAQNRWILRSQYRYRKMYTQNMTIRSHMAPLVLAYGVTPDFTLMARGMYLNRTVRMNGSVNKDGLNDLYILTKFKLYRKNSANYILGVAPYLASNIPVGSKEISNRTWNPEFGLSISYRPRFWAIDLTSSYRIADLSGKLETSPNDALSINSAFSALIPFENNSNVAVSPVIEVSYNREINHQSKEAAKPEMLFVSPGLQYIYSSFVVEGLYQLPVYQKSGEGIMKTKPRVIVGLKYMF